MVDIIPAVLATSEQEYKSEISSATKLGDWIHIDFVDGKFAPTQTVSLEIIEKHPSSQNLEAHLMVWYPSEYVNRLVELGLKRIILPAESREDLEPLIEDVKNQGLEVGISLNPETSIDKVSEHFDDISLVLLLGVHPGQSGQDFIPETKEKLENLVALVPPGVKIEIDGGVSEKNAVELVESGADILAIGSHLVNADDPNGMLKQILNNLNNL